MSRLVKKQLAEIRRMTARDELVKMRGHIRDKKRRLKALEAEEKAWTKARKAERKNRLKALRTAISQAIAQQKGMRKIRLRAIQEKRKAFDVWWREVRQERERRLTEIRKLRQDLREWSKNLSSRRRESVEQISAEAMRQLETFDAQTAEQLGALEQAIAKARRELKADEYDVRVWTSNRRKERTAASKPVRKARRESSEERDSIVEMNLESGEELAWWRRNKTQILRQARDMGISAADGIAELVREAVEADPDRALEFLQADADAWVVAELKKQGFAA
jgi:hypothetical protein